MQQVNLLQSFLILIGIFFLVLFVWMCIAFRRWKREVSSEILIHSKVIETSVGQIEYALRGQGPVILAIHGAPGGYDQGLLAMEMWTNRGFSVLAYSRPGYLQTPIEVGKSIEEQADATVTLLDSLGISKAVVLGASAGGAVALSFALRYPERISALIIVAGVSQKYVVKEDQKSSLLGRIILSDTFQDIGVWFFDVLTRRLTSYSLKQMFKENVSLPSKKLDKYVRQIMNIPDQIRWYKDFVRTTCPLSLRKDGLENDLLQLRDVSFQNLVQIQCPTLVIHGTADGDVLFSNAEYTASSIPSSTLYKLENVGHIVWLGEHVQEMNSKLHAFFKEHLES